jgi:hypothetical protein
LSEGWLISVKIQKDLTEMKRKLSEYVDKGRAVYASAVEKGPIVALKPETDRIRPLKSKRSYKGRFLAVDCSTKPLKRANNWGIYSLRTAYAFVTPEGKEVLWDHEERISTAIGDAHSRGAQLENMRFEYESKLALNLLKDVGLDEQDYLLLDGASLFGKKRRFSISLYEESQKMDVRLLAIAKSSPSLLDEKGRDFMVAVEISTAEPTWVYHPVKEADFHEHLYGDVSIIKLSPSTSRVFRCDIMQYLTDREVDELLSPLTSISEDPRCLGYPVSLFLAHDFSKLSSHSKLLHYLDLVEDELAEKGILDILRREELSNNFRNELYGIKYPFEWEMDWRV